MIIKHVKIKKIKRENTNSNSVWKTHGLQNKKIK